MVTQISDLTIDIEIHVRNIKNVRFSYYNRTTNNLNSKIPRKVHNCIITRNIFC